MIHNTITKDVLYHRNGFLGVIDAFKAWVTRKPRYTFTQPVTFSVLTSKPVELQILQAQVEDKQ